MLTEAITEAANVAIAEIDAAARQHANAQEDLRHAEAAPSRPRAIAAREHAAAAAQRLVVAEVALALVAPIRRTALGTWAETWPESFGTARRDHLRRHGVMVREQRAGGRIVLLYAAPAPLLLVTAIDRARARARAS